MIKRITLIGSGNVAYNLGRAFISSGFEVVEVYSRSKSNAKKLAKKLDSEYSCEINKINIKSDLYIIAVKDDVIERVANQLAIKNKLVVHTSGSIEIDILKNVSENYGSFYPLQTFTKDHQADFSEIPICIEANTSESLKSLEEMAQKLSPKVVELSSIQRQKLHLSAVFVSNFANYMQAVGEELCEEQEVDFNLLKPLITEVYKKNQTGKAIDNQTGPALRGDVFTMDKHLELLKNNKELSELYQLISKMIGEQAI